MSAPSEDVEQLAAAIAERINMRAVVPVLYPEVRELLQPGTSCAHSLAYLEKFGGRSGLVARYRVDDGALTIELDAMGATVLASVRFTTAPA